MRRSGVSCRVSSNQLQVSPSGSNSTAISDSSYYLDEEDDTKREYNARRSTINLNSSSSSFVVCTGSVIKTAVTREEPIMLRLARIGSCLILLLYVWASSGTLTMVTTKATTRKSSSSNYEVDARGKVLRSAEGRTAHQLQKQQQYHRDEGLYQMQPGKSTTSEPEEQQQCGLYLAPSTIPGAGLGMFSSVPRSVGEDIGTGEVIIPLVEINFYNGAGNSPVFNPFVNYYWRGKERGLHGVVAEHRQNELHGFVPGLDAAINCNLALINVGMSGSDYDDGHLSRYQHPMAGAMTPYHSTSSQVAKDIPAGGELFKFYGDRWFVAREEKFGLIPLSEDYPAAQKLVDKFDALAEEHFSSNEEMNQELWSLVKDTIGTSMWESRIMNALPQNVTDAHKAAKTELASLHQPQAIRSIEYLRQHGKCVDSIRPGPSTLPSQQGGRGAFATRYLPKDSIITGSPLNHLPNKDLLAMYRMEHNSTDAETGEETWLRHVDDIVGHQMILNYCYGHPQSTLLLCPYGSGGVHYINHNRTLANVKIQWAQDGATLHNESWLHSRHVEDLEWDYGVGLAFDYVATKDIQEGEELFLDYGDAFEEALTEFMSTWRPYPAAGDFMPAERFNREVMYSFVRTETEQAMQPYPSNLELRCHPGLYDKTRKSHLDDSDEFYWETRETGFPCRVLDRYTASSGNTTIPDSAPAEVVATHSNVYTVELKIPLEEVGLQYKRDTYTFVQKKNVDRSAIKFFNKAYTTDLFLPNAFRKEIAIPDQMFPSLWRNIQPTEE